MDELVMTTPEFSSTWMLLTDTTGRWSSTLCWTHSKIEAGHCRLLTGGRKQRRQVDRNLSLAGRLGSLGQLGGALSWSLSENLMQRNKLLSAVPLKGPTVLIWSTSRSVTAAEDDGGYLDVDLHVEGLRLTLTVADVEADHVPWRSLTFGLAVLNVEDAVRRQVFHREGRVRCDHLRTANRAP